MCALVTGVQTCALPIWPHYQSKSKTTMGRLEGRKALITGGDSGLGRALALAFAKEGADVCIAYLDEHGDAEETRAAIGKTGRHCLLIPGAISDAKPCGYVVDNAVTELGTIDILIHNAAVLYRKEERRVG